MDTNDIPRIPIPPDATNAQLRQLQDDAQDIIRSRACGAWLSSGPACEAGSAPHVEHYGTMSGAAPGYHMQQVTVRWTDPESPENPR